MDHIMSNTNAIEYADSLIKTIRENTFSGYPFGVRHSDTDEWYSDMEDARAQVDADEHDKLTEASGVDYLSDVLDIHYVVNGDRTYRAARVCIALGGPTAWINTYTNELEVGWWSEQITRELPSEFVEELDTALEELWEMGA